MKRSQVLTDFVDLNPRTTLPKGRAVPFVSMDVVSPGSRWVYPKEERLAGGSGSKFLPGDTLFARITPCLENGKIAQYAGDRPGMGSTEFFVLRAKDNVSDPAYVYYFSQNEELRSAAEKSMSGASGRQRADISSLRDFECEFPDLQIQEKIAGILSFYDELIENCQRRIRILETMARELYREWFVEFRFPGHESVRRVASPLGEIPEGWEVRRLGEITENFDRLRKPLSKIQRADIQGEYPYYGAAKVFDYINDFIFDGEYLLMAEDGSVITTEHAPVLQLVNQKFWPNNHTHVLRGKGPFSTHFLYLGLSDVNISPYITGAAQPKITQENMNRIPFNCGPDRLHEAFDRIVSPMIYESQALQRRTQNLHQTRDLLLPRLLSGEVTLSVTEPPESNLLPFSAKAQMKPKREAPDEFKEAVLIAEVVRKFSSPEYPLGRMRYNKFSYLAHRKVEDDVQRHYLKQVAGPYSPWAKYEGPEGIAVANGYIIHAKVGQYEGFLPGPKISDIDRYLSNYPTCGAVDWVAENFRYKKKEDLELITTVDFAVMDLQQANKPVTVGNVKQVISANPKWAPKLDRNVFSDEGISQALKGLQGWFPALYSA